MASNGYYLRQPGKKVVIQAPKRKRRKLDETVPLLPSEPEIQMPSRPEPLLIAICTPYDEIDKQNRIENVRKSRASINQKPLLIDADPAGRTSFLENGNQSPPLSATSLYCLLAPEFGLPADDFVLPDNVLDLEIVGDPRILKFEEYFGRHEMAPDGGQQWITAPRRFFLLHYVLKLCDRKFIELAKKVGTNLVFVNLGPGLGMLNKIIAANCDQIVVASKRKRMPEKNSFYISIVKDWIKWERGSKFFNHKATRGYLTSVSKSADAPNYDEYEVIGNEQDLHGMRTLMFTS